MSQGQQTVPAGSYSPAAPVPSARGEQALPGSRRCRPAPSQGREQGAGSAAGRGVRGNGAEQSHGGGTGAATVPAPIFSHFLRKRRRGAASSPPRRPAWSCRPHQSPRTPAGSGSAPHDRPGPASRSGPAFLPRARAPHRTAGSKGRARAAESRVPPAAAPAPEDEAPTRGRERTRSPGPRSATAGPPRLRQRNAPRTHVARRADVARRRAAMTRWGGRRRRRRRGPGPESGRVAGPDMAARPGPREDE